MPRRALDQPTRCGSTEPQLTVVIPVWDRYVLTVRDAVESVLDQEAHVAVLVVDNASSEAALQAAFPEGECEPVLADVAADDPLALGDRLVRRHGSIPLVVNNVGITTPSAFLDLEPADFDLVFRTNLRGPWFLTRQLARALVAAETGGSLTVDGGLSVTSWLTPQ